MLVFAVDAHLLWQVVWVSTVTSVGMSALFSFVIAGGARASDARRAGRAWAAAVYGFIAVLCFVVFAGGVLLGVQTMFTK